MRYHVFLSRTWVRSTAQNRCAILLGQANRRAFALASAKSLADSPHAARNPGSPLVRAGRGFDSAVCTRGIQNKSPTGLHRRGFCFEYWWRRSLLNSSLKPAWLLGCGTVSTRSYPYCYPLMSCASMYSIRGVKATCSYLLLTWSGKSRHRAAISMPFSPADSFTQLQVRPPHRSQAY